MARKMRLTEGDLMAALLAEYSLPPLLDDDITAQRMAAHELDPHSVEFWRTKLNGRVKLGDLVKVRCLNPATNRPIDAYRPK